MGSLPLRKASFILNRLYSEPVFHELNANNPPTITPARTNVSNSALFIGLLTCPQVRYHSLC